MPTPSEYKTVQSRIRAYAQEIGWMYVPRDEAARRRGFDPSGARPEEQARKASIFSCTLLHQLMTAQIRVNNLDLAELEACGNVVINCTESWR